MNSKSILIVVVVAAVLIGGYYLIQGQYKPATTEGGNASPTQSVVESTSAAKPTIASGSSTMEKGISVEYTDKGFVPSNITVKAGTKVTFVNKTNKGMWVASNPHPLHTDLPGFDALSSADNGGSYSYTFTKVGNWKYHNHLSPSDSGVITVEK